uniref:Protein quiver n=1 Tax=Ceratitis capitata TaxID=7213 RepID=W8C5I5_CERCA
MQNTKVLVSLAVFGLCCLTFANALKCYSCFSPKDCKKPSKVECNPSYAQQTRDYLQAHYTGVPANSTSYSFECLHDWLKTASNEFMYKGCVYTTYRSCSYAVNPYYAQRYERRCYQCSGALCNPADRTSASLITVWSTIILTTLIKSVW